MNKYKKIGLVLAGILAASCTPAYIPCANVLTAAASQALAAPSVFRGEAPDDRSVKLSWSKVKGADAYRVFIYKATSKKFEEYKTVKATSLTVRSLSPGTSYKFKIAALVKKGKSYTVQKMSDKLTVKTLLAGPVGTAAIGDETSVKLSWSAVKGAEGYRVTQLDAKTGKYKTIMNVTDTYCTVTGLKSGTKYTFQVAALLKVGSKYAVQAYCPPIEIYTSAPAKSQSTNKNGDYLVKLPAAGVSAEKALKAIGTDDYMKVDKLYKEAVIYIIPISGNGAEGTLTLYFDKSDRFFCATEAFSGGSVPFDKLETRLTKQLGAASLSLKADDGSDVRVWARKADKSVYYIKNTASTVTYCYARFDLIPAGFEGQALGGLSYEISKLF